VITATNLRVNTKEIIGMLKMTQFELKDYVYERLIEYGYKPVHADGFVYAEGHTNILMVAHLDTVFKAPKYIRNKNGVLSAKGGLGADDRAGVYGILHLLEMGHRPHVVFTEDEEIGCIGASKFVKTNIKMNVKYMIELDRQGFNDAVFYECDNPEFTQFICEYGFKEDLGSYSDICEIAPHYGVSAVNLSVGYYGQHTLKEKLVLSELGRTLKIVDKMLSTPPKSEFEYIESSYSYAYYYSGNRTVYGDWRDDADAIKTLSDPDKSVYDCINDSSVECDLPIELRKVLIICATGETIDVEEEVLSYFIDVDDCVYDEQWRKMDAYVADYNYMPLTYAKVVGMNLF